MVFIPNTSVLPELFLCVEAVCCFFFNYRGSSLLLGPKSIWATRAGDARIQHLHTSDHTVFAGHSFWPAISRRRSQFRHHSLRGRVWLGAEQVRSAWPQRHQWWALSSLKHLKPFTPWTLTSPKDVSFFVRLFRSLVPNSAEVPEIPESNFCLLWRRSYSSTDKVKLYTFWTIQMFFLMSFKCAMRWWRFIS